MMNDVPYKARALRAPDSVPVVIAGTQYMSIAAAVSYTIYDNGNSGAAATINWANGQVQKITLTASCTFTFSNPVAGTAYKLYLIQDGTGGRTHTWTGSGLSITWDKNFEPSWVTTASAINIVFLDYDGTTWRGAGWTPS